MEIKDLGGVSEPIKKFLEIVQAGTGTLFKPYVIRRNASAQADSIRLLSSAISDAGKQGIIATIEGDEIKLALSPHILQEYSELALRAQSRVAYQQLTQQTNLENVTNFAADEIANIDTVSEEPLQPEWISRYFDIAPTITTEDLQKIWGKVLAGEVQKPGTYSLRTLELLRNISKSEAAIFSEYARLGIQHGSTAFIFYYPIDQAYIEFVETSYLGNYGKVVLLEELGLLNTGLALKLTSDTNFSYGNCFIVAKSKVENKSPVDIPMLRLSTVGTELLNLIENQVAQDYLYRFIRFLKLHYNTIEIADIVERDGQRVRLEQPLREVTDEEIDSMTK